MRWSFLSNNTFATMWLGYTSSWETVLDQWNDGNYSNIRPGSPSLPFAGFFQLIRWSEQRAEQKQAELIGMTAEAEVAMDILTGYVAATGSSEGGDDKASSISTHVATPDET